jgi:hypothetical protein
MNLATPQRRCSSAHSGQRYVDGRRELTPLAEALEGLANGGGDITDDLGQFRIYGLAPGRLLSCPRRSTRQVKRRQHWVIHRLLSRHAVGRRSPPHQDRTR